MDDSTKPCRDCGGSGWLMHAVLNHDSGCIDSREELCEACVSKPHDRMPHAA